MQWNVLAGTSWDQPALSRAFSVLVLLVWVCGGRETVTPANNNDEAPLVDTDAAEVEKQTVSLFSM